MWQTFRWNHCVGHRPMYIKKKKRSLCQVLELVKTKILEEYKPKVVRSSFWGDNRLTVEYSFVRKEKLAKDIAVDTKLVEQALHKLNLLGIVSLPDHGLPHDCKRDKFGYGKDSSWSADVYYVQGKYWSEHIRLEHLKFRKEASF